MRLVFSVLISLIFVSSLISAKNLCQFTANEFATFDEVQNCFYSIPMDPMIKQQTIETLARTLDMYAFLDLAHNSPTPQLPIHVNLRDRLLMILNTPYKYDFDFQNDLRYLYIQLRDAHTQYYAPTCYISILPTQPFAPVAFGGDNGSNVTIVISPYFEQNVIEYYYNTTGEYITEYIEATVLAVDGVSAYEYFLSYANDSVGISKDIGARFNEALTMPGARPGTELGNVNYGYWQQRTHRNPFPTQPTVQWKLQLQNGTIVTKNFNWTYLSTITYNNRDEFLQDYYYNGSSTFEVERKKLKFFDTKDEVILNKMENAVNLKKFRQKYENANQTFTLLANSTHLAFYELNDNKTLVMVLDTMEPGQPVNFYKTLNEGFGKAGQRNLSRLIIDLTNNGGGNICLGRDLLTYLQNHTGQNWGPQDLPLSDLARNLIGEAVDLGVTNTIWSPGFYCDESNNPVPNNDTHYLLPGIPHIRAGIARNYSLLVHINGCKIANYLNPPYTFVAKDILILTNGFCGSTCALFADHLALYDNVITVAYGGIPSNPQLQFTSFPGLQVLDSGGRGGIYYQLHQLGQNVTADMYNGPTDIIPRNLFTAASYRYCIREIYPPYPSYRTLPTEYTYLPADHHIYNTEESAVYPEVNWYRVLQYFPNK